MLWPRESKPVWEGHVNGYPKTCSQSLQEGGDAGEEKEENVRGEERRERKKSERREAMEGSGGKERR